MKRKVKSAPAFNSSTFYEILYLKVETPENSNHITTSLILEIFSNIFSGLNFQ